VIKLGKRIQDAGYKLIVDFHYSDTWADPGKQTLPKAWEGLTTAQLATKVYDYTTDCLQKMKAAGVTPDLIQTGNEITYGMLWPTGQVYPAGGNATGTMANFTSYLNNAIKACREQCPQAKIILHTELGNSHNSTVVFFKKMKEQNIDFDVIGLSYYPDYHGKMATFNSTLTTLEANNPGKPIMIMETGYGYEYALPGANTSYKEFAITQDGQAEFAKTLISTLKQHSNVMGLFWWWPEANEYGINWQNAVTDSWWNASLFNNRNGRATKALYELKNFLVDNPAGIEGIDDDRQIIRREYYNLLGKPCSANSKGVKIEKIIFNDGKTKIRKTI
jgi:arabinogalactan endo-1,4-beta-galactosidase